MRILLSGVAGFIGINLAIKFLELGDEVIGVDNFITGQEENIQRLSTYRNFSFVEHDTINFINIEGKIDWILNFACPASPVKYLLYPIETLRVCSEGTYNLLELARRKNSRFLLASTSEVYGDAQVHPQSETYLGNVSSIGPRSVYDEGKRYAESLTMAYHNKFKISTRIIRVFNTYGPYMSLDDGRIITNIVKQMLQNSPISVYGDGTQTRSFQYIDDLVDGIIRLMSVEYYTPVNLGNPDEYSILEVVNLAKRIYNGKYKTVIKYFPLPKDDPKQRKPDITLAKKILGWQPIISLEEGLMKMFEYFESNKDVLEKKASL